LYKNRYHPRNRSVSPSVEIAESDLDLMQKSTRPDTANRREVLKQTSQFTQDSNIKLFTEYKTKNLESACSGRGVDAFGSHKDFKNAYLTEDEW